MFQRFISFSTAAALILAMLPIFASSPAQARFPRGSASGCAYATDNGCLLANANGSFKDATLLTSAQQSGQNSLLPTHPMTFNIPGVDYPIGPDKTLTPKDPRTITADATTPCAYIGTGGNAPPNDYVGCFGAGTFPNAVLDNYDFSGAKIGKSSLTLFVDSEASAGSKLTVTNSYFSITSITGGSGVVGFNGPGPGNWSIKFWNNQCDGSSATATSGFCLSDNGDLAGTTVDIRYNVFSNQGVGRVMGGAHYASTTWKFNYINGLNSLNTTNHGEVELRSCGVGGCNTPVLGYEGNFIVWDAQAPDPNDQNQATFVISTGDSNEITFGAVNMINNVVVVNTEGSPPTPTSGHRIGQSLFGMRASNLGDVAITGNWLDSTGATDCGLSGAASGGTTVTAQQTGNTLTITGTSSSFNNNPIDIGWMIFHSGYTTSAITAFGTGSGNLGTYTVNGSPQSVGSDSLWTVVPGFNSFTASNNFSLADPSHTGVPAALGYNGPTMQASVCPGAN